MDATWLSAIAGAILSLLLGYFPGLSTWYGNLVGEYKRLVMAGLLLLVAAGAVGLACWGYGTLVGIPITCDQAGIVEAVKAFIAALVANQATFLITTKSRCK